MDSPVSITGNQSGRRLETGLLLRAYRVGLFPMADSRDADDVFWVEPRRRGILPIGDFHLSGSLARTLKRERFTHSRDRAFEKVIAGCAAVTPDRPESWINGPIADAYMRLHAEGHAHSIETWDENGQLVGGLYGVRIGAAFFGESMFSRQTDASKAALAHLILRLRLGGFRLLDTQFLTSHLESLGGKEVRRTRYLELLADAIDRPASWVRLDHLRQRSDQSSADRSVEAPVADARPGAAGPSGKSIVQLLSQTS